MTCRLLSVFPNRGLLFSVLSLAHVSTSFAQPLLNDVFWFFHTRTDLPALYPPSVSVERSVIKYKCSVYDTPPCCQPHPQGSTNEIKSFTISLVWVSSQKSAGIKLTFCVPETDLVRDTVVGFFFVFKHASRF